MMSEAPSAPPRAAAAAALGGHAVSLLASGAYNTLMGSASGLRRGLTSGRESPLMEQEAFFLRRIEDYMMARAGAPAAVLSLPLAPDLDSSLRALA